MAIFLTADLHLGDVRCLNRRHPNGGKLRPFDNLSEMDATLIGRWNDRVGDADLVYILGDLCTGAAFDRVAALRGRKRLVLGNCDSEVKAARSGVFEAVVQSDLLEGITLTHVPLPLNKMGSLTLNAHGHLHAGSMSDARYVCVSVEQTEFAPISLEQVLARFPVRT